MMKLFMKIFFAVFVPLIEGNILLNKPSTESGSFYNSESEYGSFRGNDGDIETISATALRDVPYWQADLQGFYMVVNISLTTPTAAWHSHIKNAFVGVSVMDMTCAGSDVIVCGQWPDENLPSTTLTFSCNLTKPVRFVRVWKETRGHIGFSEVEATGTRKEILFASSISTRVSSTSDSLSVSKATECGTLCYQTESCIAFSFRQGGQLNCLLATDLSSTSDPDWITYKIRQC